MRVHDDCFCSVLVDAVLRTVPYSCVSECGSQNGPSSMSGVPSIDATNLDSLAAVLTYSQNIDTKILHDIRKTKVGLTSDVYQNAS